MWGEDIEAKEVLRAFRVHLALLLIGFLWAPHAHALRTVKYDLNGLLDRTAFIFTGEVTGVDFAAGEETPRTRVTFRVHDVVAGYTIPAILDVELPMGLMADGTVLDIAEAPRFVKGHSYLVLYKRGTWNVTPVVGFDQGHYRRIVGPYGAVYVSAGGHCVTGLANQGFVLGPRVAPRLGYPAFGDTAIESFDATAGKICMPASTLLTKLVERVAEFGALDSEIYDTAPASDILFHRLMGPPKAPATKKGAPF